MKTPATPFRIGRGSAIASDKWQVQDPPVYNQGLGKDHRTKRPFLVLPSPARRRPELQRNQGPVRSLWILDDRKDAAAGPCNYPHSNFVCVR